MFTIIIISHKKHKKHRKRERETVDEKCDDDTLRHGKSDPFKNILSFSNCYTI